MSEAYRTSIEIDATPDQVFDYFVRPELLVRWMGNYARLEAVEGERQRRSHTVVVLGP
jgi:uncharacterized protein YndB with AHSA1/START domain